MAGEQDTTKAPAAFRVPLRIQTVAMALRDECMAEMSKAVRDPETYGDPGDAIVMIKGNSKNVLDVLYILDAIGVPGCRAR